MNLGIVFFDDGIRYPLQVFAAPVDLKLTGNRIHEAFVSFKNGRRTGNSVFSKQGGMRPPKGRMRIG